jgi:hypothetical protein
MLIAFPTKSESSRANAFTGTTTGSTTGGSTGGTTGGSTGGSGHWDVTYTVASDTFETDGPCGDYAGTWSPPYNAGGCGTGGGGPLLFCLSYGDAYVSGTVTAHLVWNDGNGGQTNPPEAVVVEERSFAAWGGDSGSCSCGLTVVDSHSTANRSGDKSGLRWTVKENPGTSFDMPVSCSMSAYGHVSSTSAYNPYGGCYVSYGITPHDVRLNLDGGLVAAPGTSYLIGQLLTGTIVAPYTVASRTWSVSGGEPFKRFDVDFVPGAQISTGHRVNLASTDLSAATLACCFARTGSPTISCALHLTLPELSPTGGLAVTVSKDTATVAPTSSVSVDHDGTVILVNSSLHSGATLRISTSSRMDWSGTVTSPSGYGSDGGWNFTQLITLGSSRHVPPSTTQTEQCGNGTAWWTSGLDTAWGYEPQDGLFPDDGTEGHAFDCPSFGLEADADSYSARQDFEVYQLYLPPGTGSQYVPLKKFTWYWTGTATWGGSPWVLSGDSCGHTAPLNYPSFPDWDHLVQAPHITFR